MQASARLSSSAAFRKVIVGVSSATTRSCYRTSRGKAHAAPLPAQEPPPKGQRKIAMQQRRARIIEFVENYRALNDGKFPSIKNTRQQVGGAHYTVREVLQEMEYNHAKLQLGNNKAAPLQGTVEATQLPMPKDEARVVESQGILEVAEQSMPKDDAEVAQLQGTLEVSEHCFPKDEAKVPQSQVTFEFPERSRPKDDIGKTAKHDMDTSETCIAREDNPKFEESTNTGLLGSLKSFAYGIRNFWKNM